MFQGDSGSTEHYDGLHVMDGSTMPGPPGGKSIIDICSLAFRVSDYTVGMDDAGMDGKKYWPK